MKKTLLLVLSCFAVSTAWGRQAMTPAPLNIRTIDGTASNYPYQLKVPNGDLTDNADGTMTLVLSTASLSAVVVDSSYTAISQSSASVVTGTFIPTLCKAAITPTSTSYKVNIRIHGLLECTPSVSGSCYYSIFRNTTSLGSASGEGLGRMDSVASAQNPVFMVDPFIQDAPATTSSVTYTLYMKETAAGTVQLSRNSEICAVYLEVVTK